MTEKEIMLSVLISNGLITNRSYYGATSDINATYGFLKNLVSVGVDLDKTDMPTETEVEEFDSTFSDGAMFCHVLTGNIVANDGKQAFFEYEINSDAGIIELVRLIKRLKDVKSVEEAAVLRVQELGQWSTFSSS